MDQRIIEDEDHKETFHCIVKVKRNRISHLEVASEIVLMLLHNMIFKLGLV